MAPPYLKHKRRSRKRRRRARRADSVSSMTAAQSLMALTMGLAVGVMAAASALLFVSSSLLRLGVALFCLGLRANQRLILLLNRRLPLEWTPRYLRAKGIDRAWVFAAVRRSLASSDGRRQWVRLVGLDEELSCYLFDRRKQWRRRYRPWRVSCCTLYFLTRALVARLIVQIQAGFCRIL